MSEQSCKNCRFFQELTENAGNCRRFPPVLPPTEEAEKLASDDVDESGCVFIGIFPAVYDCGWCGEWQGAAIERVPQREIGELNFSVRTYKTLRREGVFTIDALCRMTQEQLLEFRNFGGVCLQEVREKLAAIGLSLAYDT